MNSLNILSGLTTTPPPSPPRSRTASLTDKDADRKDGELAPDFGSISEKLAGVKTEEPEKHHATGSEKLVDEKTPLLGVSFGEEKKGSPQSTGWQIHRRIAHAIIHGLKVVYTTITAPGRYVIACFYDDQGHFSAILPLKNFKSLMSRRRRKGTANAVGLNNAPENEAKVERRTSSRRSPSVDSVASSASIGTSDGETETDKDSPAKHTRSRTSAAQQDVIAPQNKSIKIKLHPDESLRKRKAQKLAQKKAATSNPTSDEVASVANTLKSPSSPSSASAKMTRYPRTPQPPRPIVPRRHPSYSLGYSNDAPKKTLIIDLDETLIHSMAKGGRMSTGHMVEVRLNYPTSSGAPNTPAIASGVPILYYVHERPACHEFLRKVSRWYNLVVFTASVQEYADPVIDWLERERKYFAGRYYRQHCTFRNGAYIKDLAQVEPDLSRVMILDNSPMSYIFHEGSF